MNERQEDLPDLSPDIQDLIFSKVTHLQTRLIIGCTSKQNTKYADILLYMNDKSMTFRNMIDSLLISFGHFTICQIKNNVNMYELIKQISLKKYIIQHTNYSENNIVH
jgi:hypothetical protein